MYWMNRYIERAENYARFMDVNFNLALESPPDAKEQWTPLVVTTGDWDLYESRYEIAEKTKVLFFLGFDEENPNSILSCIFKARENARAIRPELTKEVWEQINRLYFKVKDGATKKVWLSENPRSFFTEIKEGCQLLYGIFDATISRTPGWHFGKIGQMIERADKTSRVLDVKYHILLVSPKAVGKSSDLVQWAALLKSVSAFDMYRKKYGKLTAVNIAEFLLLDRDFPRSILRCLLVAEQSLYAITGRDAGFSNSAEKQLGMLKSQLEFTDIADVIEHGLHEYLDNIQVKLNDVSNAIFESFFSIKNVVAGGQFQQSQ